MSDLSLSAHLFLTFLWLVFSSHSTYGTCRITSFFCKECEVSKQCLMSVIFQRDGHQWHSVPLSKSFGLLHAAHFLQTQQCWRDFTLWLDAFLWQFLVLFHLSGSFLNKFQSVLMVMLCSYCRSSSDICKPLLYSRYNSIHKRKWLYYHLLQTVGL